MELEQRKPTSRGPTEWFTGDVYIDAVARGHGATPTSIGLVHFMPGARTAWHAHEIGQTLYVIEGEGRVQPGQEWHWHGAAPHRLMTHLAVSEGGAQWGDHVTDAEYRGDAD